MEDDTDEEEMEDVKLDDERKIYWRMGVQVNDGGVDDQKALLHATRWDVYVNEKENINKGEYLVEVFCNDGRKVHWEVADDHVAEEATRYNDIGLRKLNFYFL